MFLKRKLAALTALAVGALAFLAQPTIAADYNWDGAAWSPGLPSPITVDNGDVNITASDDTDTPFGYVSNVVINK